MPSRNYETFRRLREEADFEDLTSDRSHEATLRAYAPDFEIVEPPSLPQGGVHKGRDAWLAMHGVMRSLWHQKANVKHIWDLPEDDVIVLYTTMEWTAKATGRTARWPTTQVVQFRDGLIARVEVFHHDTKLILDTLEPSSEPASVIALPPNDDSLGEDLPDHTGGTMPSRNMETYLKLKERAEFASDLTARSPNRRCWRRFTPDFEIVEPPSLPQGGVHKGREAWLKMHGIMRSHWHQKVNVEHIWDVPEQRRDRPLLLDDGVDGQRDRSAPLSFLRWSSSWFRDGLIAKVEMFLQDTKIILDTLEPS